MSSELVYHVNVHARRGMRRVWVFNMSRERLQAEVVGPWLAQAPFELADEDWEPRLAELRVLEGRRLVGNELGLGEGPNSAKRTAEDVTRRILEEAQAAATPTPAAVPDAPVPTAPGASATGDGDPRTERIAARLLADLAALDGVSIDNEEALGLVTERLRILGLD